MFSYHLMANGKRAVFLIFFSLELVQCSCIIFPTIAHAPVGLHFIPAPNVSQSIKAE